MAATAIVFSCLFFAAGLILLPIRQIASPCCGFMGLLIMSFAKNSEGIPVLPISSSLIIGWLCMTVVVTVATLMQPAAIRDSRKGMGYLLGGSIVGMAIGLLGFTMVPASYLNALYAIMVVATAAGTFFGYLVYTRTPDGAPGGIASGNFFRYLMAKGFPTALTVMQIGVVLVLLIARYTLI